MTYDEQLKLELYLDKQKLDLEDLNDDYKKLILFIVALLEKRRSMAYIRSKIKSHDFKTKFKNTLIKYNESELRIIAKASGVSLDEKIKLNYEATEGKTFEQEFEFLDFKTKDSVLNISKVIQGLIIAEESYKLYMNSKINRQSMYNDINIRDLLTSARNYIYDKIDKIRSVKGWVSIAVLDSRTTQLCTGLHGVFYSREEYKSRLNLPYPIPRHFACRSKIISVGKNVDPEDVVKTDLNSFFERNEDTAIDIIGKTKYKLWKKSGKDVRDFFNSRTGRFFTNKDILRRFGD